MSAVRKQLYYFWKKLSERQSRKKFETSNNRDDIERFKKCTEKKPARQIAQEMKALQNYWGCYPYQYYRFDFFRKDCTLSLDEMKQYVPHFFIMSLFFPHSYKDYGVLCEDKLLTYATLKAYDISQPKLLFCFDHKTFFDSANNPLSNNDLNRIINACTAAKVFVKPRFGLGGKGIEVFNRHATSQYINNKGTALDYSFFFNSLKEDFYIVQEGLAQHESLNRIYPHSINTFRVITECGNGKARVLYALLRIGRSGNQVDNASSGGMYVKVDPQSGVLSDFAYAYNRLTFDTHPDTGFVFKGAVMDNWTEVKSFAIHISQKFRDIRYLGWDIAFTTSGPAVIEINNGPDMAMIQDFYGGVRNDLKINPKDWWYQSNYTIKNL